MKRNWQEDEKSIESNQTEVSQMLFFDDGKKLEKAFTQDQFDALVSVLEKREDKAATKEDLKELREDLEEDIKELREDLKEDVRKLREDMEEDVRELREDLKKDVRELREDLKALELKLNASLRESELRTQVEIEKIRAEIEKIRAELGEKLESNKHEILKWITGMVVAQAAVFIALAGVAVGLVAFYK